MTDRIVVDGEDLERALKRLRIVFFEEVLPATRQHRYFSSRRERDRRRSYRRKE